MTVEGVDEVDERIQGAAMAVLRERGYSGLSMEGVAVDAGVAKTTVYRRYRNRADLATAALATAGAKVPTPDPELPTRDAILAFLKSFADRFEHVGLDVLGSLLVDQGDEQLLELHRQRVVHPRVEQATALMRLGQERGEVRPDADPRLALEMMVGSFFSRHIAGREMDGDEWAEQVVALMWRGLEA